MNDDGGAIVVVSVAFLVAIILSITLTIKFSENFNSVTQEEWSHCHQFCGDQIVRVYADGDCACRSEDGTVKIEPESE